MITLDKKYSTDEKSKLPNILVKSLIDFHDYFSEFENKIISLYIQRFNKIEQKALKTNGNNTKEYILQLYEEANILAEYYKKSGQEQEILLLINKVKYVVINSIDIIEGIWLQEILELIQSLYRKYHLYDEAKKVYVYIRKLGPQILTEKQSFTYTIPIPNDKLEDFLEKAFKGNNETHLYTFLLAHLPIVKRIKENQEIAAKNFPLLNMIHSITFNEDGIPINHIKGGAQNEKQHFIAYMNLYICCMNFLLHKHIIELKNRDSLNTEWIMKYIFNDSKIIKKSRLSIIKEGFDAYFNNNYIVACHLLIPQFESAIRILCANNGGEILRAQSNPEYGNEYISLDRLLDQKCVQDALGIDITTYYKILFTESNGKNYRNLISHGLLEEDAFNEDMADRIFHAFLLLGLLRPTSNVKEQPITNNK